MPKVSVVIPCYNQGSFLEDSVSSVLSQSYQNLEIIIVNDGSNDEATNTLLKDYSKPKTKVITTDNQGLAAARNNGIAVAEGEYILPLDADDKIGSAYIEKAVAILGSHPEIGIVYCKAMLFGHIEMEWILPDYSLDDMLCDNIIFCSAFFRKQDWLEVGGYDTGMRYGWEDYEFWLALIEKGKNVYKIPEVLFFYRVSSDSMVRSKEKSQKISMFRRIFQRHQDLFLNHIEVWIDRLLAAQDKYFTARLYVDTGHGTSGDEDSVARKVEKYTFRLIFNVEHYKKIKCLRFDPVDTYVVVKIGKISLIKTDGTEIEVDRLITNETYRQENYYLFTTDDPQFLFNFGPETYVDLKEVVVELSFQAIGEEALVAIMRFQEEMIANQHVDIEDLKEILEENRRMGIATVVKNSLKKLEDETSKRYIKRHLKSFIK